MTGRGRCVLLRCLYGTEKVYKYTVTIGFDKRVGSLDGVKTDIFRTGSEDTTKKLKKVSLS